MQRLGIWLGLIALGALAVMLIGCGGSSSNTTGSSLIAFTQKADTVYPEQQATFKATYNGSEGGGVTYSVQ